MRLDKEDQTGTLMSSLDDAKLRRVQWKWTLIAAFGDYLDAGAIVAGGASLAEWIKFFHLHTSLIGIIAALSANGIAAGVGAILAGRLGDLYGRKVIYAFDLLFYAFGVLVIIFSFNAAMLVTGYMLIGLAVGADVPTSWSLIAEFSPKKSRGKLMGLTNIFWYIGPIIMLVLSLVFSPLGILGARLVFASLGIVALIAWVLRRQIPESARWSYNKGQIEKVDAVISKVGGTNSHETIQEPALKMSRVKELFTKKYVKRLWIITPLYLLWLIPAGTYGFFLPYIFRTLGDATPARADILQIMWFASAIITVLVVYMPLNDRINRRVLYVISAAFCSIAFFLFVFFPITNPIVAIANVLLFGFGQGIGLWPLQRVWSVELFPTEIRNTAQGFLWAIARFGLGFWSLALPFITKDVGFTLIAALLGTMFVGSMIIGGIWGPKTEGQSLEAISS